MQPQDVPVTQAVRFLREKKIAIRPHSYPYEEHGGTGQAALMLKIPEHSIVKTLIMETDSGQPFIVLQHGNRQVSTKQLARALGVKRVAPCEEGTAQRYRGRNGAAGNLLQRTETREAGPGAGPAFYAFLLIDYLDLVPAPGNCRIKTMVR
jgi:hypothetical protein